MSNFTPLSPELESEEVSESSVDPKQNHIQIEKRRLGLYLGAAVIFGSALVLALASLFGSSGSPGSSGSSGTVETANASLGETALTQNELFTLVKDSDLTAYWAGPQEGAKYSLTVTEDKHVFIKYLPGGEGLTDASPTYRVIATYPEPTAFDITKAAGTMANSVGFVNDDGAAIYYDKANVNNIYLAYSGIGYSIEVFDPNADNALALATVPGSISKIE